MASLLQELKRLKVELAAYKAAATNQTAEMARDLEVCN